MPTSEEPEAPDGGSDASETVEPRYDVFLAAVAEAVEGTRFAETPFESPEVVISTGLVLCEALADGEDPEALVFEYLTDLTGGSPETADDDQLPLVGALIGAAEAALCADSE